MLTHDNLLSNVEAAVDVLRVTADDIALSFLPLSHAFERMVLYAYLYAGAQVAFAESPATLARDMVTVRPTLMTGVPRVFENELRRHPLVAEAVLIGDRRKFIAALLVPDFPALERRLAALNRAGGTREALVVRSDVVALFREAVDAVNASLAPFETIKRFTLIPSEFTVSGGELTPTMKVKRRVVEERWRAAIDTLYEEGERPIEPSADRQRVQPSA
jgi:long-subunit acyl-CoA synthetase (AMP-forming)